MGRDSTSQLSLAAYGLVVSTLMLTDALAAMASVPMFQVTVLPTTTPKSGLAVMVTPAGSVSTRVTPVACAIDE